MINIQVLRKNAIPFHNPYRTTAGQWNPLRFGKKGSTISRILSLIVAHQQYGYHSRVWKFQDLQLWAEWLQSDGVLKHGAKKRIAATGETLSEQRPFRLSRPGPRLASSAPRAPNLLGARRRASVAREP